VADCRKIISRGRIGRAELGDHRRLAVADQRPEQERHHCPGPRPSQDRAAADQHRHTRRQHREGEDDDPESRQRPGEFRRLVGDLLPVPVLAHQVAVAARAASLTKGLVARSWPKVDIGPWPGTKAVSSPIGHSRVVIDRISCCWSPRGKSQRPTEPWNSTSPTVANRDSGWWKTTWPGVWPGQWRTSRVSWPSVTWSPSSSQRAGV